MPEVIDSLHLICARLAVIPVAALMLGCSSVITLRVTDPATGDPIEGLRVERYRPASRVEKVFNPVGTTYHPLTLAQSTVTDTNGVAVFSRATPTDVYRLYATATTALDIAVSKVHVKVSHHPDKSTTSSWVYSVWMENGAIRHLAEPVK